MCVRACVYVCAYVYVCVSATSLRCFSRPFDAYLHGRSLSSLSLSLSLSLSSCVCACVCNINTCPLPPRAVFLSVPSDARLDTCFTSLRSPGDRERLGEEGMISNLSWNQQRERDDSIIER